MRQVHLAVKTLLAIRGDTAGRERLVRAEDQTRRDCVRGRGRMRDRRRCRCAQGSCGCGRHQAGLCRVLLSESKPALVVVTRSADVPVSARAVFCALTARFGGRGAGKPDLAQGAGWPRRRRPSGCVARRDPFGDTVQITSVNRPQPLRFSVLSIPITDRAEHVPHASLQ